MSKVHEKEIAPARWSSRSQWFCAPFLTLSLLGCQAADDAKPEVNSSAWLTVGAAKKPTGDAVPDGTAKIVGYRAEGSLCPGSARDWNVSGGTFALYGHSMEPSESAQQGTCKVHFQVQVPAGQRFGNPLVRYSSYAIGQSDLSVSYAFAGGDSVGPVTRHIAADDDVGFTETFTDFWSPACDANTPSRVVDFTIDLQVGAEAGAGFGLQNISGGFGYESGVSWQHCADGQAVVAAGAAEGESCSLVPNRPCAAGLTCDLFDNRMDPTATLNDGECVDRSHTLAPQPDEANCGGARGTTCEAGLVCHYASASRAEQMAVGVCTPESPVADQPCGGFPVLDCADGLSCAAFSRLDEAHVCQSLSGKQDDPCGDGLPECAAGLSCNGGACRSVPAQEGAACGGVANLQCTHNFVCDPDMLVCVPNTQKGKLGATCAGSAECDQGLTCLGNTCAVAISNAAAGETCRQTVDCQSGLICAQNHCAVALETGEDCASSEQCREGLVCFQQHCAPRDFDGSENAPCFNDDECGTGLACIDGQCHVPSSVEAPNAACVTDADCAADTACSAGSCQSLASAL